MNHGRVAAVAIATALSAALGLSGCSGGSSGTASSSPSSVSSPAFVIDQDFPDPDVLHVGDIYYAYATNTAAANVQFATSRDLTVWTVSGTTPFRRFRPGRYPARPGPRKSRNSRPGNT